ncbi:MAG: UvrB/UvrC motif-containing protein, partial [Planctomycetota bacterium]
ATEHKGKHPRRIPTTADAQAEMIQLRREMEEAVEREDYELASEIRDRLKSMEPTSADAAPATEPSSGEPAAGSAPVVPSPTPADRDADQDTPEGNS